jgi:hypothetical protein
MKTWDKVLSSHVTSLSLPYTLSIPQRWSFKESTRKPRGKAKDLHNPTFLFPPLFFLRSHHASSGTTPTAPSTTQRSARRARLARRWIWRWELAEEKMKAGTASAPVKEKQGRASPRPRGGRAQPPRRWRRRGGRRRRDQEEGGARPPRQ